MQCSGNSSRNVTVYPTPTFSGTNDYTIVVLLVPSKANTALTVSRSQGHTAGLFLLFSLQGGEWTYAKSK